MHYFELLHGAKCLDKLFSARLGLDIWHRWKSNTFCISNRSNSDLCQSVYMDYLHITRSSLCLVIFVALIDLVLSSIFFFVSFAWEAYLNLLKPSGYFTYRHVWISKILLAHYIAFMCFVRISEQTETFVLYFINLWRRIFFFKF